MRGSSLKCIKTGWLVINANGPEVQGRRSSNQALEQKIQKPQPDQTHVPYYKSPSDARREPASMCTPSCAPAWGWWQSPVPGQDDPGLLSDFTAHVSCVHSYGMCKALYKIISIRVTQHITKHPIIKQHKNYSLGGKKGQGWPLRGVKESYR